MVLKYSLSLFSVATSNHCHDLTIQDKIGLFPVSDLNSVFSLSSVFSSWSAERDDRENESIPENRRRKKWSQWKFYLDEDVAQGPLPESHGPLVVLPTRRRDLHAESGNHRHSGYNIFVGDRA